MGGGGLMMVRLMVLVHFSNMSNFSFTESGGVVVVEEKKGQRIDVILAWKELYGYNN